MDMNYKIADLKQKDYEYFKSIEDRIKMETGKDFVLIAWEKSK
nr:hypothetical protein [Sedimentibacter sp.]